MGRAWKEALGGVVQSGVYQASPRHASRQFGSFKTGRPPRLPFQFVTYFQLNPEISARFTGEEAEETGFITQNDPLSLSAVVRAIDMPTVQFTVDKKNAYNRMRPVITSKEFKGFSFTVYDDIESRWYAFWQHYYNWHFMDGRNVEAGDTGDSANMTNQLMKGPNDIVPITETVGSTEEGAQAIFNSDKYGLDIHTSNMSQYLEAIHVWQIHGQTATRTTAVNPLLTNVEFVQNDYASSGQPSEITFSVDYERLVYGKIINMNYEDDPILKELIEDVTKAPVFDPTGDKLRGLVKGLFGLEQSNVAKTTNNLHDSGRDFGDFTGSLQREDNGLASRGFFGTLLGNAVEGAIDRASSNLFKKNNKNISKLNFN